ncbi:MAG: translation elongation factor Ts [Candidatus Omnitrophica bacterium]|nr:translation elongation factor Ts [Candidatus Omnitrophota bacterium]
MVDAVRKLRDKTNAGIMDCKTALKESNGDIEKAIEILRKKGKASVAKRIGRTAKQGIVESYIHMEGKLGVLVEINCESDFVARNEAFRKFTRDMAMQIAASRPLYVTQQEVPAAVVAKEKEIAREQLMQSEKDKKKPAHVIDEIVENKVKKFFEDTCLVEQPFIKDSTIKVKDLIEQLIATMGENIVIRRFSRFQLGEEL